MKKQIIITSNNQNKIKEIKYLLPEYQLLSLSEIGYNLQPKEDGSNFEENAIIKIKSLRNKTMLPILSDDSGLCIDDLNGEPGIYSARWLLAPENNKDLEYRFKIIYEKLGLTQKSKYNNKQTWHAHFICTIVLSRGLNNQYEVFEGRLEGKIVYPPQGQNGFGYEPIFQPITYSKTFAELSFKEKQAISHRAIALNKLKKALQVTPL